MSKRITIDPITRIEGHLRIDCEIDAGRVRQAWASGQMFRGVEQILLGRDPRDAWAITQRFCGVCTTVHAIASVRAVSGGGDVGMAPAGRCLSCVLRSRRNRATIPAASIPSPASLLTMGNSSPASPASSPLSSSSAGWVVGAVALSWLGASVVCGAAGVSAGGVGRVFGSG